MTNFNNSASAMYALSLAQCAALIDAVGSRRTVLLQGDMGNGKSATLPMIAKKRPTHTACFVNCATKDLGDLSIPHVAVVDGEGKFVRYVPNEELGLHLDGPVIMMLDEFGKANPAVKNALLNLIYERKLGSYTLHPDSIVYATTNKGSEGVGDILPPHARNRMIVVGVRKSTNIEWIEWGIENGIDHTLLGWCKDNPQLFNSFEDLKDPEENPSIYHPRSNRTAFVTPRSLEAASDIIKMRNVLDDQTITGALMGTIGERAAMDLMAFVALADKLPTLESIKTDPLNAKVPDNAAAVCMVVYRTLAALDRSWVDAWMDYMPRLDKEAQGMFANGARSPNYSKMSIIMTNNKFKSWAMANNYLFVADKK